MPNRVLLWFRRDLRLADNPALHAALDAGLDTIVPVFIHAPDELGVSAPGAAACVWQHDALDALARQLEEQGSRLILRHGPSRQALANLIDETGAGAVYWNRLYDPDTIARDKRIKKWLDDCNLETASFNAHLLYEPWAVATRQGGPYKVFTPFWKAARQRAVARPLAAPDRLPGVSPALASEPLESFDLIPRIRWDRKIRRRWQPGENGAHARLEDFLDDTIADYDNSRERPAQHGTSYLSPHLHHGEIGPRQILHSVAEWQHEHGRQAAREHAQCFISEIGWREFAHHVLYHFPSSPSEPLDTRFKHFPWSGDDQALARWQQGQTGIPMVDAGMRELWATGYMHNRLRMTVASFLTKNLRIAWQHGERWFWDTLVDADLANNTLGWQWAAGCGADAAPFFRIFNPVRQGQRFDPEGDYIRQWIPELAGLDAKTIHQPWKAPASALARAGITLGKSYPEPIVDLQQSRREALEAFDRIKTETGRK